MSFHINQPCPESYQKHSTLFHFIHDLKIDNTDSRLYLKPTKAYQVIYYISI